MHISSSDAFILPTIDPRYFSAPIDLNIQIQSLRSGRKAFKTDPLASLTNGGESVPGFKTVPDNKNQGAWNGWRNWIMKGFSSVAHPVGTCAMASKELGGCVDAQFKVYGTDNVRVVDASVLPFQVSAHLSSTLYGVAEKAAETIKMANNA